MNAEQQRLDDSTARRVHWKRWGPYLSERQWGTVREDYSADGDAWSSFPFEHSHLRAYRWGEDGIGGISDRHQYICFSLAMWNHRDPILKERLYGLTGRQGNHAEDVKEVYYYLDSTPTHSYMKFLYKYPQAEFPYGRLQEEARRRGKRDPEPELWHMGVFDEDRCFDVQVEYAKAGAEEIAVRITVHNRGPVAAPICLLPTIWFRNTWSWQPGAKRPGMHRGPDLHDARSIEIAHDYYGHRRLLCQGDPEMLFTENETNRLELYEAPNRSPFVKDAFHRYVIKGDESVVSPRRRGTKAAALYRETIGPGDSVVLKLRLIEHASDADFESNFDRLFEQRIREADEFYAERIPVCGLSSDGCNVQRQAYAGMMWTKQFYHFNVRSWMDGDPLQPDPPPERRTIRNSEWRHLYNEDVLSMPDKWEYPWFAAWDTAFHMIPIATIDPTFAKDQLLLFLREWYMHPNGQIPAYEWNFSDVNPPVHAWAAWRVYKIDERISGKPDRNFLERIFHKLLLNFTWWVNRKDPEGHNVFQGGFLGLDNIGIFDRSNIPEGLTLQQSDSTSWMAMYCLDMLAIALELAQENRAYSDVASKFFEHFVYITGAVHGFGSERRELWDELDGFYYDALEKADGSVERLKVRSLVGLFPLFASLTLDPDLLDGLPGFKKRLEWFMENRPILRQHVTEQTMPDGRVRRLLSIVSPERLPRVLRLMLDEEEFLSPHGIRSLSRIHRAYPYEIQIDGRTYGIKYEPAESETYMFGGNSNWRGPIWFPVNFLLIESLQRFHYYLGDDWKVACPTGSEKMLNLWEVSEELSHRLTSLFLKDEHGRRPMYGGETIFHESEHFEDLILFHEYFHGDNGAGLGASHQTGWTGLAAKLLQQSGA